MNADDPMIVVIGYGFVVFFIAGNTTLKNAPLFMIQNVRSNERVKVKSTHRDE